jgi:O-antigen ligase
MVQQLKTLFVVMTLAMIVFVIAKPFCLRLMDAADFTRRRNTWIFLTTVGFLAPSFWVFVPIAAITYYVAGSRDTNPAAFFLLLLHVIPPNRFEVYGPGGILVFPFDNYRVLILAMMVPAALRIFAARNTDDARRFTSTDFYLLAFSALTIILYVPYESPTNTVRRVVLLMIDVFVPYYVFSRSMKNRRALIEVMTAFCLCCAIFAAIAGLEAIKKWPFYSSIAEVWGIGDDFANVYRGDSLRAQASAGHPLAMGYLMALAFGFWLFIATRMPTKTIRIIGGCAMWLGLLAAYSRAPWLTAIAIFFMYLALQPQGLGKAFKWGLLFSLAGAAVLVSPLGSKIIDNLPFVGTVDLNNVVYRQRLADISWYLIQQNPLFGDPFVLDKMEEMRQGEGIIDLVNVYASQALFYGGVGLSLFLLIFLSAAWRLFRGLRQMSTMDPDLSMLGANLLACLLGTMFFMATGSFGTGLAMMAWVLVALSVNYEFLIRRVVKYESQQQLRPELPRFVASRYSR